MKTQDPNWNDAAQIRCQFTFKCPKTWNRLRPTAVDGVRHCSECDRDVFLVLTEEEFRRKGEAGRCVAVPVKGEESFGSYVGNVTPPYGSQGR
jgi:hypothetical protein